MRDGPANVHRRGRRDGKAIMQKKRGNFALTGGLSITAPDFSALCKPAKDQRVERGVGIA